MSLLQGQDVAGDAAPTACIGYRTPLPLALSETSLPAPNYANSSMFRPGRKRFPIDLNIMSNVNR